VFPLFCYNSLRCLSDVELLFAGEWYHGDVSAPLDRDRDLSLMSGTVAGYAPGQDFAPLGNEKPQRLDILVVNERRFVHTEPAYLFSDLESSFSVSRPFTIAVPIPVS